MSSRSLMQGLVLVFGLAGCGGNAAEPERPGEAAKDEAHVVVRAEPARTGPVTEAVEGLGRVEALPDHLATLTPAVEGHVHALLVKQGDPVQKGQVIVELDKTVALADLAEKTATRNGLEASLKLLQSLPRPDERRSNELAIEQAKVSVERAQHVAERLRPLLARHEVSEQQVYEADQAVVQAKLQQQTAEAQLKAMLIGPRPEAVAEAQAKITTANAAVELSNAHLEFCAISAPIDGVLDSLTCHPGQTIAIGAPIGEVVDTRQVFATVWLAPQSAQSVRVGQSARLSPAKSGLENAVASSGSKTEFEGKVAFVGRVADTQTGNLPVRVLVENPDGRVAIGETVELAITIEQRSGVLQVPAAAIFDLGEGPLLNVVREGKTVVLHPEVGRAREGWVPVSGTDLKEGESVIVEGGYNLPEGTAVKVSEEKPATAKEETP
jgi:RND family efflux transporter MFP subunit